MMDVHLNLCTIIINPDHKKWLLLSRCINNSCC